MFGGIAMLTIKKFTRIAEECGFKVDGPYSNDDGSRYIEISQYTPAGEDWNETIDFNKVGEIEDKVYEFYENWDSDEEAEIWIGQRGTRGVPDSIQVILDDQKWKENKLKELNNKLTEEIKKH